MSRRAYYRGRVLDCVSRGIPKPNYTSSLSGNKHPYPQESKLNASEKITHARTHNDPFAVPHEHRGTVRVSRVLFFFAGQRGWTFRATKKDTLSATGSPQNTLEFRPPTRSIESACFSSSGKTILPSYYC